MGPARYLAIYALIALGPIGLLLGGWWTLLLPLTAFGVIPLSEVFTKGTTFNMDTAAEKEVLDDPWYDRMVYGLVPVQWTGVVMLLAMVGSGRLAGWEVLGGIAAVGTMCGALGINLGHELGHRRSKFDRRMSKLMLLSTHYTHFFIEHNRGHHANVSTPDDPASADRGEVVYAFWFKSIVGGWKHAWALEARRLKARGVWFWAWENEMVRFTALEIGSIVLAAAVFGPLAAAAWMGAALGGILLLETTNYVEHYGLRRGRRDDGRWERVRPVHSWNSNHPLSRLLLFELTRHSDHHAHPSRHFSVLRHFEEAPQLPTGYSGMVLLALLPPVFFKLMHPRIDAWAEQTPALAA
jgi:alkane 1-monooxygenase